jgi:hypothetical protein
MVPHTPMEILGISHITFLADIGMLGLADPINTPRPF